MRERVAAACIKSLYKSLYKLRRALSLTYNAPLFVYYKNADLLTHDSYVLPEVLCSTSTKPKNNILSMVIGISNNRNKIKDDSNVTK